MVYLRFVLVALIGLMLVVTPSSAAQPNQIALPLAVVAPCATCSCDSLAQVQNGWRGTINVAIDQNLSRTVPIQDGSRAEQLTVDHDVALNVELTKAEHQPNSLSQRWYFRTTVAGGSVSGPVGVNDRYQATDTPPGTVSTYTLVGGPNLNYAEIVLDLDLISCNFSLSATLNTPTTLTSPFDTSATQTAVVLLNLDFLPLRSDSGGNWAAAATLDAPYDKSFGLDGKRAYSMGGLFGTFWADDGSVIAPASVSLRLEPIK